MNDLSMQLNMSDIGCNINGIFLNHFVYADDMCIVAPCVNALQLLLNICMKYADTHDITYNIKKSVCMYMKSSKFNLRVVPRIYLNGNVLQYVNTYKYLGCIISNDLKDDNDIKKTIRGIYARSNMLIRRFYNCSSSVKKFLFKTYCTNLYCAQLWWFYSAEAFRKVRTAFNNSFRHLMGYSRRCSASGMFVDDNIDDFNVLRRKYVCNFNSRLQICQNSIIVNIQIYRNCYALPSVREFYRTVYTSHVTRFLS